MRWLKRDIWKAGIALAGLLLLVLMVWVPVSAGAYEGTSGTAIAEPVQGTPTEDATVTALQKEQLILQNKQLEQSEDRGFDAWLWNNAAAIVASFLSTLVVVGGALIGFWQWRVNRDDIRVKESNDHKEAQDKELRAQAEERFKAAVTALGDGNEGVQIGGAILLRSFLNKGDEAIYGRYYTQIFDLAVAYLCSPRIPNPSEDPDGIPRSPKDPNTLMLLTPLRKALVAVFKEVFPLAWKELKHEDPQSSPQALDASGIRLDGAFLDQSNLQHIWMREASLNGAHLTEAYLKGVYLRKSQLRGVFFNGADLRGADLSAADFSRAHLSRADLSDADLSDSNLSGSSLERARSLKGTNLRGVTGLTKEQLAACKAKGAIVDEDITTDSSQSDIAPQPSSQSNDGQALSAVPAQMNTPLPSTDGSSTTSSQTSAQP